MWILAWLLSCLGIALLCKFYYQSHYNNKLAILSQQAKAQLTDLEHALAEKEQFLTAEHHNQEHKQTSYFALISKILEDSANDADLTSIELEQVTTSIQELTDVLHGIKDLTIEINRIVDQGDNAMLAVHTGLVDISHSGDDLKHIQTKFEQIIAKTQDISYIGAEAEMLALNATIEAARAGDAGRGFAVVADNMKALAQRSQSSTQDVLSVVNDSEQIIQKIVDGVNAKGHSLEELVEQLVSSFSAIEDSFKRINQRSSEAVQTSEQTSASLSQVSSHVKTSVESLIQKLSKLVSTLTGKNVVDLTPLQAKEQWQQFDEVIDVRREKEWHDELGHIANVTFSTLQTDFKQYVKSLDASKNYLFICRSGGRSTKAAQMAITNGITSVHNLEGGMLAWRAAGY